MHNPCLCRLNLNSGESLWNMDLQNRWRQGWRHRAHTDVFTASFVSSCSTSFQVLTNTDQLKKTNIYTDYIAYTRLSNWFLADATILK